MSWNPAELRVLSTAHSLRLSVGDCSEDSVELGMVLVEGELLVRAYRGLSSRWFRAAVKSGIGSVSANGLRRSVVLAPSSRNHEDVESAYSAKYGPAAGAREPSIGRRHQLMGGRPAIGRPKQRHPT
jgi:hypothetical protein